MQEHFDRFVIAFDAAAQGDVDLSRKHLAEVNSTALQDWFHDHGQNSGSWRAGRYKPERSAPGHREKIDPFMPTLFARDGYRCRYCGQRVVPKAMLLKFAKRVGAQHFSTTGGNHGRHGIIMCFRATLDHVIPVAAEGETSERNLVTACWPCNYGKSEFMTNELGIDDPFKRPPVVDDWRGLTDRTWVSTQS